MQEITNIHQSTQQSTTRVGALMAHHPAWVSHHTCAPWSIPTVHPFPREGGASISPTPQVTQDEMSPKNTKGRTSPRNNFSSFAKTFQEHNFFLKFCLKKKPEKRFVFDDFQTSCFLKFSFLQTKNSMFSNKLFSKNNLLKRQC